MTWAQFWLKPIVTCGLGQMVAEWQHSPAQQYFCSTDWSVISGVEGGVFSSQFSLFDPQRSLQVDRGRSSSRVIRCLLYLAAQCRDPAHLSPPAPSSPHTPVLYLSICGLLVAPTHPLHPLALFWMHGFHVVPPSAPLNLAPVSELRQHEASCRINTASAHSMVRVSGSVGPRCARCWCWIASVISGASCWWVSPFFLFLFLSLLKILVPTRNDAWPTV